MSLGKLLTTGKSLMGLHNSNSRYHLQKGALPKFESSKNPFMSRSQNEALSPGADELHARKLTPAEIAAANLKKTQRLPLLNASPEAPAQSAQPAISAGVSSAVDGWLKKLNPLVWLENRKPAPVKSAVPRFNSKTPVQGELSLDNIKVMRNDLSDVDVEVVPMKPRPPEAPRAAAGAAAMTMAVPELPSPKEAWEYLGERLLGKH